MDWLVKWVGPSAVLILLALLTGECWPTWRAQPRVVMRVDSTQHGDHYHYYAYGRNGCSKPVAAYQAKQLRPGDTLWVGYLNWTCP